MLREGQILKLSLSIVLIVKYSDKTNVLLYQHSFVKISYHAPQVDPFYYYILYNIISALSFDIKVYFNDISTISSILHEC